MENEDLKTQKIEINKLKNKTNILGHLIIIGFFLGFSGSGARLILIGINEGSYISVVMGTLLFAIGSFILVENYFQKITWLSYFLGMIPVIFISTLSLIFVTIVIFIFFYVPFYETSNLNIDLGIIIIKDVFVRFLLIIFDLYLIHKGLKYLKKRE